MRVITDVVGFNCSADEPIEPISTYHNPPTPSATPTIPRHTAPQREEETPKSDGLIPLPQEETVVQPAQVPIPRSAPHLPSSFEEEMPKVPSKVTSKPTPTRESSPAEEEFPEPTEVPNLMVEKPSSIAQQPKQNHPSPSPQNEVEEQAPTAQNSEPVVSAEEGTSESIIPKEKPTALQDEGSSGVENPQTKLVTKTPTQKPPPEPVIPPLPIKEKPFVVPQIPIRSPPVDIKPTESPAKAYKESAKQEDEEARKDPKEEDRLRHVAPVAPTLQSNGSTTKVAPPVDTQKPLVKRPVLPKPNETKHGMYRAQQ